VCRAYAVFDDVGNEVQTAGWRMSVIPDEILYFI